MKKQIHICDKCEAAKVTSESEVAGYRTIQIGISKIDCDHPDFGRYSSEIEKRLTRIYLCEECLNKLGITNERHGPKVEDRKST